MSDKSGTIEDAEKPSPKKGLQARLAATWEIFTHGHLFMMLLLGFSSGLPFLLVFGTLSAWLRTAGVSRTDIGLMSYVGLAYTIKFLWAPLIDQIKLPLLDRLLGKRRAWMALVAMSFCDPATSLLPIALLAVTLAFASATQDIAIDAWRIEAATDEQQGAMAAAYQLGYRFAIIASGAGALYLADFISWHTAYLAMACLMGIGMAATFFSPRLIESKAHPLYIDLGFSLTEIATIVKLFGVWMTIFGAVVGCVLVASIGIIRSLFIGASAVMVTNFMFSWLATQGADLTALTLTISAENFSGGIAGTCLIAYMSSLTAREFTATQYALFSSIYALPGKLLGGQSGRMVDAYGAPGPIRDFVLAHAPMLSEKTAGYVPFFLTTGSMAIPALILIVIFWRAEARVKSAS